MIAMWRHYDKLFVACVGVLLSIGFVFLYSISANGESYFVKQLLYAAAGVLCFAIIRGVSIAQWRRAAFFILLFVTALLLLTAFFGVSKNGAQRWLSVVVFTVQPAEFLKVAVLICVAHWLALTVRDRRLGRHYYRCFLWFIPAFLLLLQQPDFGSFALLTGLLLVMVFLSGSVRPWLFITIVLLGAVLLTAIAMLEEYRLNRITGFIDPFADPYNTGYHQRLALIAFWRGGWWGDGLGRSIGKLEGQLPEAYSDFIVAIIAEEIGYVGLIALCGLFTFLMARIIRIGAESNRRGDVFSALVAFGAVVLMTGQAFINIAGNLSLIPLKGMTLPLISYGGSSLLSTLIILSLILRADRENHAGSSVSEQQ